MKINKDKSQTEHLSPADKMLLRNGWLKIGVVSLLTVTVVVKVWQMDFSTALGSIQFSELLALGLAMFSVGLAVLFYFKVADTSNTFYDNTYRFTKDVSEILGRVEAGFGERLKNLDEGYTGLRSAVEKIPYDRATTEKGLRKGEEEVARLLKERAELIQNSSLQVEEKEKVLSRLQSQDEELSDARIEIQNLRQKMRKANGRRDFTFRQSGLMISHLKESLIPKLDWDTIHVSPSHVIEKEFKKIIRGTSEMFQRDLREAGVIDEDGVITSEGRILVRELSNETKLD